MNIKSLLLGSAAALVAVSGARAADAVMAEPEAVEYVRVCDAYGAGYFYIPGTETCLKIGGYVRYDMRFGETNGLDTDGDLYGDAWDKRARFSLQFSTASDTELGTLKTYAETRFNWVQGNTTPTLNFAWIQLGGLRIGKDESAFTTFAGYAGKVINDGQVGFGPFDVTLISYTYDAGNGFSAILSLEDDKGAGEGYMPDVVAGAKYAANGYAITGVVAYDESSSEFAGKLRLDAEVGEFSAFIMGGYASGSSSYTSWSTPGAPADWALWAGASYKVSDKISLNAEVDYADGGAFGAAANVVYTVVPGFKITTELNYQNSDLTDNRDKDIDLTPNDDDGQNVWGGTIRFQRSF